MVNESNTCGICDLNYYMSNGKCVKSDVLDLEMGTVVKGLFLGAFVFLF